MVGGAAWAAMSFFSTGAQPAEALPGATLGYVSIDLDPSGAQKIEAVRTLNKFPEFKDQLGLETDDDVRKWIFDEIQGSEDACAHLDYEDDVESWLGNRAAAAAVDLGDDQPASVVVVQVTDGDAAAAALVKLQNCTATGDADKPGSETTGGFEIAGDWAVLAESQEDATRVVAATEQGSLADDSDYQKWTDAAGDAGIVSMYASPDAAAAMFDSADALLPMAGLDPALEELLDPAVGRDGAGVRRLRRDGRDDPLRRRRHRARDRRRLRPPDEHLLRHRAAATT